MELKRNRRIKELLTKEFLEEEYCKKKKSTLVISDENNVCKRTVLDYLISFNIPRRTVGEAKKGQKRSLESRKKQSKTMRKWDCHPNLSHKSGKENPNYRHGRYIENYCECGRKISAKATHCVSCANKGKRFGKISKSAGWRGNGDYYKGIWMRSSWEILYAVWLDLNGIEWYYEPKMFVLEEGKRSYRPDFYLPEFDEYVEIKGWFNKQTKEKLLLFSKKYPHIKLRVITKFYLDSLLGSLGAVKC